MKNNHPDLETDVVVIGAGLAGLVSAALLVSQGIHVRVIERDIHPGGCAASFIRTTPAGEFQFQVGATLATGFETGGFFDALYKQLGIKANFLALNPSMRVRLNQEPVQLFATRQEWNAELKKVFPDQEKEQTRFWRAAQHLADTMHHVAKRHPVMPWKNSQDVLDTARAAHWSVPHLLFNLNRTVGQAMEQTGTNNPKFRALLDGQLLDSMQTTSQECVWPNGAYALEIYRFGAQYMMGGLASVATQLATYIDTHGGQVHYATRAKNIVVQNNQTKGIQTSAGFIKTSIIISSAPIDATASLLGEACPPELKQRSQITNNIWGAFTIYMGVHQSAIPEQAQPFEQITDFNAKGLTQNFLVSSSHAKDTSRAPQNHRAITISTHVQATEWFGLSTEAYTTKKRALETSILERLTNTWPQLQSGIVHLESGTPKTFANFTLHPFGRVGGIPQTLQSANFKAQHHNTGIQGLFMAGETIFPGQGTPGVLLSGYNAQRSAARYLQKIGTTRTKINPQKTNQKQRSNP